MRRSFVLILLATVAVVAACSSSPSSSGDVASDTTAVTTTAEPSTTSTTVPAGNVLASFPDAAAADAWVNVDDSVMGGVSDSRSTWTTEGGVGALAFEGVLSTERNGGFSSTLGPIDRTIGQRAAGARALAVDATGDGRTYLLQLRGGGGQRWIARFTPPPTSSATRVSTIAVDSFEAVTQFLRPMPSSAPLDPSTINQIGVYVLDGQVGQFRLVLVSVTAVR